MGYFRDLVIKSIVAFSFLSLLITNLGESQPPYHEDTQAVLWKRPCGEELRPPANSQVSEASWERIDLYPDCSRRLRDEYLTHQSLWNAGRHLIGFLRDRVPSPSEGATSWDPLTSSEWGVSHWQPRSLNITGWSCIELQQQTNATWSSQFPRQNGKMERSWVLVLTPGSLF